MEAFAYLHSPVMKELKKQIDNGLIGNVNMIESVFFTPGYEDDIRIRRDTLGGSVYDLGCYTISFASCLFGSVPLSGQAVSHFTGEKIDDLTTGYLDVPRRQARGVLLRHVPLSSRGSFLYLWRPGNTGSTGQI